MPTNRSWWCNICNKEIVEPQQHLKEYKNHWLVEITKESGKVLCSPIWGQNADYTFDDSISSTLSCDWQRKLRHDVTNLIPGEYRIGWYCEVKPDDGPNRHVNVRVKIDNRIVAEVDNTAISDDVDLPEINKGYWLQFSGFCYEILANQKHSIVLEYCSSGFEGAVYIRRARLELWRVK